MSWLARLYVPRAEAWGRFRRLTDCYAWHRCAWECFPNDPLARRDFLIRLDAEEDRYRLLLLAQREPVRPAWARPEWWSAKEVAPTFLDHDLYAFDVVANPARKVHAFGATGERKKNSVRKALTNRDEQLAWLEKKGAAGGFALCGNIAVSNAEVHFFRKNDRGGLHVGVRFQGMLRVTDRDAFRQTFTRGIGSARAFGFGLLMLRPHS